VLAGKNIEFFSKLKPSSYINERQKVTQGKKNKTYNIKTLFYLLAEIDGN